MGGTPKHQDKELRAVIKEAERKGWTVARGKKYYKLRCSCGNPTHQKTVRLTPSNPNYEKNLRGWFKRTGCWEEDQ